MTFLRNFSLIFLLILGPSLIFLTNNISNYSFSYLQYPLMLSGLIFLLIIFFFYTCNIFLKKNLLKKGFIFFISILWFLSFYFRDVLFFFNIASNEKFFLKVIFLFTLVIISLIVTKKKNLFIENFLFYLITFFILINFFYNANFNFLRDSQKEIHENRNVKISEIDTIKKNNQKNVYFFLTDELTSAYILNELGLNIDYFIKKKIEDNFQYLGNSKSSHNSTQYSIGTIFNMEYYKVDTVIYPEYFYPQLLYKNEKPNLIKLLKNNQYKFWMMGNQYIHCIEDKYVNCIENNDLIKKIIEDEGLNVFINKTFFDNLYYKLKKYYYSDKKNKTEIEEFYNFLERNNNLIKNNNNFFFIHSISPHYPYRNENCEILNTSEKFNVNDKNYISSVKCTLKNINLMTDKINKIDSNSIIIFQSDHGFSKFYNTDNVEKSYHIFNLVKFPKTCSQFLQKNLGTVETINAVFDCLYGKKRKFENPGQSYITDETKIKYKKFYILKR
jgi:hypothetical protein